MNAQFLRLAKVVMSVTLVTLWTGSMAASGHPLRIAADESSVAVHAVVTQLLPMTSTTSSMVLQPLVGVAVPLNVSLASDTRYIDHGILVTSSALQVGVVVTVNVTGSPAVATSVDILSRHRAFIEGTVSSESPVTGIADSLIVQPRNSKMPKVSMELANTTLYFAGGIASTLSSLSVGDQVQVVTTGQPAAATLVNFEGPKPISVMGTVSTRSATTLTVLPQNARAIAVAIAVGAATIFKEGSKSVDAANLVIGSQVQILASGSPETALLVDISPPTSIHFSGIITELTPFIGPIKTLIVLPDGFFTTARELFVSPNTVYWSGGAREPLAALLVGAHVSLSARGDPLSVTTIVSLDDAKRELVGRVVTFEGSILTLQPNLAGASRVNLKITPATMYYANRQSSSEESVHVGEIVRITTSDGTSAVITDVEVLRAQFVGRVMSLSGDSIVVKSEKNILITVHVTDTTHIILLRTPAHITDVVLGARIAVAGVSTSDSAAIIASSLVITPRDIPLSRMQLMGERPPVLSFDLH